MEMASGVAALMLGFAFWGDSWWPWLLIAAGVLGLSPWPGAAAILRKAQRSPDILLSDPERRRRRARRTVPFLLSIQVLGAAVVGYLVDGWPAAIFMAALIGFGGALGAWWFIRREEA